MIFYEGQIKNALNLLYKSDVPSTIVEFKKYVERYHAGPPDSYSAIVILCWQDITEENYNYINVEFLKL